MDISSEPSLMFKVELVLVWSTKIQTKDGEAVQHGGRGTSEVVAGSRTLRYAPCQEEIGKSASTQAQTRGEGHFC